MQTTQSRKRINIAEVKEPVEYELTLDAVLRSPTEPVSANTHKIKKTILNTFNKDIKRSVISYSSWRGIRIKPDEFLLVHCNGMPELADYRPERLALPLITGLDTIEELGTVKQNAPFFGGYGKYVVNVPSGHYALATEGNDNPLLLDAGMHVIQDATFKFDPQKGFVQQALAYINHGNIHILRVPKGKLAKIWLGNTPKILDFRKEPYIFNTPYFQLVKNQNDYFFDTATKRIEHGSLKRLMPLTGEVAITYNNGALQIIDSENAPFLIDSETHIFKDFLDTTVQTLELPSDAAKRNRTKEGATANEVNYIVCATSDSRKIGIKLIVAYEITNPTITLTKLTKENITAHIEGLATSDMGKAIAACNSQTFLNSRVNIPKPPKDSVRGLASAPELETFQNTLQDDVKNLLAKDLDSYGIKLIRLNIERYKILDEKISHQMEQQSLLTSEIGAKQAVLEQEFAIAKKHAEQQAEVKRIEQENANLNKLSAASAEKDAAVLRAQALLIEAEAKQKAASMEADVYRKHPEMLQLALAKLQVETFKGVKMTLTTHDWRTWTQNPATFFNSSTAKLSTSQAALLQFDETEEDKRTTSTPIQSK